MVQIKAYAPQYRAAVLELSVRAWVPVFPLTRAAVPEFVYDCFYPDGWEVRKLADMAAIWTTSPRTSISPSTVTHLPDGRAHGFTQQIAWRSSTCWLSIRTGSAKE